MKQLTKAQITIGILAYFATIWILIDKAKNSPDLLMAAGIIVALLLLILLLSYIIMSILQWIDLFDLQTNAIITLVVLTSMMINITIYLLINTIQ